MNKRNTERTDEYSSKKRILIKCIVCGKEFFTTAKEIERGKKYCSNECRNKKGNRVLTERVIINCLFCGKEMIITKKKFENGKKYCSTNCQHDASRGKIKSERVVEKCLFCGKEFTTTKWRFENTNKKYCSKNCCNKHKKELYVGEKNPAFGTKHTEERKKITSDMMKKIWKTENFSQNFKDKLKVFILKNGYSYGLSEISNKKRKETILKNFGVDHIWKSKDVRKKIEKTCIEKYGKTSFELMFEKMLKTGVTKIEAKIKNILIKNNIKFKRNFYVYFNEKYKIYDFYLHDYNLLLEADGDYWHGNPEIFKLLNEIQKINKSNDEFKNELAKRNNFNLERFWECDIKKENFEEALLEKIKNYEKNSN